MNYEAEYSKVSYTLTAANAQWGEWAAKNVTPAEPDKNFEIVYVGLREYDDGYKQIVVCIRQTDPNVVQEKNVRLPAEKLVMTQLLFFKTV